MAAIEWWRNHFGFVIPGPRTVKRALFSLVPGFGLDQNALRRESGRDCKRSRIILRGPFRLARL